MAEIEDSQLVLHWHYDPTATGPNAVLGLVNPNGAGAFGNLVANVPLTPTAVNIGGVVPADEVWELLPDPVITFDGGGLAAGVAPQDFALQVLLDQGTGNQGVAAPWGYWRGAPDLNPDTPGMWTEDQPTIPSMASAGALAAVRASQNPRASLADIVAIMARTYKVISSFNFVLTPLTEISSIIDLKWYGKRWSKQAFAQYLQGKQPVNGKYTLSRSVEKLAISFPLAFPALDFTGGWANQIGGGSQGTTQAWAYRTVAINTVASTLNTDLTLGWNGGQSGQAQVENANENLAFSYNPRTGNNNVLDVDSWGTVTRWAARTGAGTNLRGTAIWAASDTVNKYHPEYGRLVTDSDNPYGFAWEQGWGPANGKSRRVPKFRFPIFGDQINFVLRDNGTGTIAANTIATAVRGTMVSNYPYVAGSTTVTRNGQPV